MTIQEIVNLTALQEGVSIGFIVLVILLSLVQVSKIKLNPWDAILGWIGNRLNKSINDKVEKVEKKLDQHIAESEVRDLRDTRQYILDFANACMYGRKYTYEQFKFVIKKCDEYEKYVEDNHIKNGEVTSAISYIRKLYDKCRQNNSFLREDEALFGKEI